MKAKLYFLFHSVLLSFCVFGQYNSWQKVLTIDCGDIYIRYKTGENKFTLGEFQAKLDGGLKGSTCLIQVKATFLKKNGKETEGTVAITPDNASLVESTTWDGIASFSRAEIIFNKGCNCATTNSGTPEATFTIDYHNEISKGGKFVFKDPSGEFSFEASSSAGHMKAANNPYTQSFKDMGPLPAGTWKITSIKNEGKSILRLTPMSDVVTSNRDGFLIHGHAEGQDPASASHGCIILEKQYRDKLKLAFKKNGAVEIKVRNRIL